MHPHTCVFQFALFAALNLMLSLLAPTKVQAGVIVDAESVTGSITGKQGNTTLFSVPATSSATNIDLSKSYAASNGASILLGSGAGAIFTYEEPTNFSTEISASTGGINRINSPNAYSVTSTVTYSLSFHTDMDYSGSFSVYVPHAGSSGTGTSTYGSVSMRAILPDGSVLYPTSAQNSYSGPLTINAYQSYSFSATITAATAFPAHATGSILDSGSLSVNLGLSGLGGGGGSGSTPEPTSAVLFLVTAGSLVTLRLRPHLKRALLTGWPALMLATVGFLFSGDAVHAGAIVTSNVLNLSVTADANGVAVTKRYSSSPANNLATSGSVSASSASGGFAASVNAFGAATVTPVPSNATEIHFSLLGNALWPGGPADQQSFTASYSAVFRITTNTSYTLVGQTDSYTGGVGSLTSAFALTKSGVTTPIAAESNNGVTLTTVPASTATAVDPSPTYSRSGTLAAGTYTLSGSVILSPSEAFYPTGTVDVDLRLGSGPFPSIAVSPAAVPEPASFVIFGIAGAACLLPRLRRRWSSLCSPRTMEF